MRRIISNLLVAVVGLFLASALLAQPVPDTKTKDASKSQANWEKQEEDLNRGEIYHRVIHASGLVVASGKQRGRTYGTCWVVSEKDRWVVTNWHVVKGQLKLGVLFPTFREGEAITGSRYYKDKEAIGAKLVAASSELDLAVLQVAKMPDDVKELKLSEAELKAGQTVFAVGNAGRSKDNLWRFREGEILRVKPGSTRRTDGTLFKAQVIESTRNSNPGDSGGPVVDSFARVVGIHRAGGKVSTSIHVQELRTFLKKKLLAPPASRESVSR
jgi:S1-C subfamily serine protease